MKKQKKEKKNQYSIFSNLGYMVHHIRHFDQWLLFYLPLPMIANLGLSLLGIYIPKIIIDLLTQGASLRRLLITVLAITLLLILFQLGRRLFEQQLSARSTSQRVYFNMPISTKTLETDYENIACKAGQDLRRKAINAINSDNSGAETIIRQAAEFLKNSGGLLIYAGILVMLNPFIVLLLLVGAIINILVAKHPIRYEHKHKDDTAPIDSKIMYMRENTINGKNAKDVRIYHMAGWLMQLYDSFIRDRYRWDKKIANHRYMTNISENMVIIIRDGLAYTYLIYSVLNGLSVGDFVLYFGAITGFSVWLSGLVESINEIRRSSLEIGDMRGFLNMEEHSNRGQGIDIHKDFTLPCDIELLNVSYKYKDSDQYVIKNLSLKIKQGEKLAIVGMNGAGKTTIVKIICGLLMPEHGQVLINKHPIEAYNMKDYQSLFSVAFQDACIPSFSISDNITMTLKDDVDLERLELAIESADLVDKINSLKKKVDTYINNIFVDDGIELSGGEKQKLILARALYKDAAILVLDEPTAALDPIAESRLYEQYAHMAKDKTSIYISHRLASTRFCDRIIFLEEGRIVEDGSHQQLMALAGKYAHMFNIQSHYYKEHMEVKA